MKLSELILKLQALLKEHGDREVFAGGEDYPGGVSDAMVVTRGDGYLPEGCVKIQTRN